MEEAQHSTGGTVAVTKDDNGYPCESPIVLPRPVPGLVSRRVLVMDYLNGVPLSRAAEEMLKKGIEPNSPESQLFGRRLLKSLTEVFGRCILETGFFHAVSMINRSSNASMFVTMIITSNQSLNFPLRPFNYD